MAGAEELAARATPILERLVGFDTTSHLSNLALIEWVEAYLADLGVASRRGGRPARCIGVRGYGPHDQQRCHEHNAFHDVNPPN